MRNNGTVQRAAAKGMQAIEKGDHRRSVATDGYPRVFSEAARAIANVLPLEDQCTQPSNAEQQRNAHHSLCLEICGKYEEANDNI
ncbi:hypothetical protein Pan14r_54850 [Crateriforma conspicua]|uniref:Uncharacterized protein n=3 Tax=Crateriforma conspicua TaxID=2527996 RepID=A0A5C5XSA6_9PLAN|nr:hypothetical protein Pan14r_54850 [Crateriforma conspicua]